MGIEPMASPLPRACSTTELRGQTVGVGTPFAHAVPTESDLAEKVVFCPSQPLCLTVSCGFNSQLNAKKQLDI